MNKLEQYFFDGEKKLPVHKWHHYFEIYDRHFKKFIGKKPTILEIGIARGGSLEMWNHYFDNECTIYGIDINDKSEVRDTLNMSNIHIDVGDQSSVDFWKQYLSDKPKFDIVVDDGGHKMDQQITTIQQLYDHVYENGVYLCEDTHTSYWHGWNGGYKNPDTFIEHAKDFVDGLHYQHIANKRHQSKIDKIDKNVDLNRLEHIKQTTDSIHFYDSVVVIEKRVNPPIKPSWGR